MTDHLITTDAELDWLDEVSGAVNSEQVKRLVATVRALREALQHALDIKDTPLPRITRELFSDLLGERTAEEELVAIERALDPVISDKGSAYRTRSDGSPDTHRITTLGRVNLLIQKYGELRRQLYENPEPGLLPKFKRRHPQHPATGNANMDRTND